MRILLGIWLCLVFACNEDKHQASPEETPKVEEAPEVEETPEQTNAPNPTPYRSKEGYNKALWA